MKKNCKKFEADRLRAIAKLMSASSPADREKIRRGVREGRRLRRELERMQ